MCGVIGTQGVRWGDGMNDKSKHVNAKNGKGDIRKQEQGKPAPTKYQEDISWEAAKSRAWEGGLAPGLASAGTDFKVK